LRRLEATPERMVERNGQVNFGTFHVPFHNANVIDAPLYAAGAPRFWKKFRLKEWQHYGIVTPGHYIGMVIFDAKFMGISFFYIYDRQKNTRIEYGRQVSGKSIRVAREVYQDRCFFEAEGYHLSFDNNLNEGFHRITVDIKQDKDKPNVRGEIIVHEDLIRFEPLVQVSPITRCRPFYTHKTAVPASGRLVVDSCEIALKEDDCLALVDEQKTFYPYVSFWKWATAAGYTEEGRLLAFNLCQNMITDDSDANENCFWFGGKITCLKEARFSFDDPLRPWKMRTADGRADLTFRPVGERAESINIAGLIRSDFRQPFGYYNGTLTGEDGRVYQVRDFFGLAEHHVTRY